MIMGIGTVGGKAEGRVVLVFISQSTSVTTDKTRGEGEGDNSYFKKGQKTYKVGGAGQN